MEFEKDTLPDEAFIEWSKNALSGIGLPLESATRISTGQMNRVFQVNGDMIFRFSLEKDGRRFPTEAKILQTLHRLGEVKVPEVIHTDFGKTVMPFDLLVTRRKPGVTLARAWLSASPEEKENYLKELCGQLQDLHHSPLSEFPFLSQESSWSVRHEALLTETFEMAANDEEIDGVVLSELRQFARAHREVLHEPLALGLTHSDIHFENILAHEGGIEAILDFEYAGVSALSLEIAKWLNFAAGPGTFVETALEFDYADPMMELVKGWQKHYPELFKERNLPDRLRMYLIPDVLGGFKWSRVHTARTQTAEQVAEALHTKQKQTGREIALQRYERFFKTGFLEDLLL